MRAGEREQINMGADSMRVATPDFSQLPRMEFIFRAFFFFFLFPFFSKGKHVTDFRVTWKRLSSRPLLFKEREEERGREGGGKPFFEARAATRPRGTARHSSTPAGKRFRTKSLDGFRSPISSVCYDDGWKAWKFQFAMVCRGTGLEKWCTMAERD